MTTVKEYTSPARNKVIVGKNSASYNDKHPHNPVQLRPVSRALHADSSINSFVRRAIKAVRNWPRNDLINVLRF